jgi:branched-chain amino acid transport system substrate-binding protein
MKRRTVLGLMAAAALGLTGWAMAQELVKVGLILPMTGQQASTGKQIKAAVDLYMAEHGTRWPARRSR